MHIGEALPFGDVLVRAVRDRPDHIALVLPGERYTYTEVLARSVAVARSLRGLGVRPGDHVGLLMPNCSDFVFGFFGATLIGAVVVPVNARFKRRELAHVIPDADLVVILTSDVVADHVDFVALLHESLPGLADAPDPATLSLADAPLLRAVVLLGDRTPEGMLGRAAFEALAEGVDAADVERLRLRVRLRDVGLLPYTSGTTSHPKGCILTHEAVIRDWLAAGARFGVGADDVFWDPCPLFHMSGIGPMLFTFGVGGTFVTLTHFDAKTAIAQMAEERPTVIYPTFPPITLAIFTHPDFDPSLLSQVKAMLNVAPPDTLRLMQAALPHAVQISCFGLTEGAGVITYNELDEDLESRLDTTGPPLPGVQVKIVDPETGTEVGIDEPGEICIRGYNVFEGYHKDPEKTAATFDEEGWAHTGDTGSVDHAGRVRYLGRTKDMLKVGGENVAPSEIESWLSTHPAVHMVQVVGRDDERYVEVPVAFVELSLGGTATAAELIEFCQGELASFKVPREVRFVTEWPMSATKVQKFKLRELAAG